MSIERRLPQDLCHIIAHSARAQFALWYGVRTYQHLLKIAENSEPYEWEKDVWNISETLPQVLEPGKEVLLREGNELFRRHTD